MKPGSACHGLSRKRDGANRASPRVVIFLIILLLLALLLTFIGCNDPLAITDDAERDLDRPRAELDEMSDPEMLNPYDTRPSWSWESDPIEGTTVFRYRLNGGDWTVLPPGPPPYEYTPDGDLYPGTYVFEVQERNAAGTWSESCSHTTVILVREPTVTLAPPAATNEATPTFSWVQWNDGGTPQYGATGRFSGRLQFREGSDAEWSSVAEAGFSDVQDALDHTITSPLEDGLYRFSVAERNTGGARSLFFQTEGIDTGDYVIFRVDTVPPNPPLITSVSLKGPAGDLYVTDTSPIFTWTTGGPDGTGEWEYRVFGSGYEGEIVPGTGDGVELFELQVGQSYTLELRERDEAGNWSAWATIAFSVRAVGTILIENPEAPTLSIDGVPVVIRPNSVVFTAVAGDGIFISSYQWRIDGEVLTGETAPTLEVSGNDYALGEHTLTLLVVIDGVPYSEQFGFVIVEE